MAKKSAIQKLLDEFFSNLQDFGDSSVDLLVIMNVVVDSYAVFLGKAREAIYNAFSSNGIEIPFPQRDVYIKEAPKP